MKRMLYWITGFLILLYVCPYALAVGGLTNVNTPGNKVSVSAQDIHGAAVSETAAHQFPGAEKVALTYETAQNGGQYLMLLTTEELPAGTPPTKSCLFYIAQAKGAKNSVSFGFNTRKMENGRTYYAYLSGGASEGITARELVASFAYNSDGQHDDVKSVQSVSLDRGTLILSENESAKLAATISPSDAGNQNVRWETSNASVATVRDGMVTALSHGEATIRAVTEDGGKTASCVVSVLPAETMRLCIEKQNAAPGATITIPILLKNNPGVIGFSFALQYEDEKLEYLGASDGDFIGIADNISVHDNQLGIVYSSASKQNLTGTTLVYLTFRVQSGAKGLTKLSFVVDETFDDGFLAIDLKSQESAPVAFAIEDGQLSITDFIPGDINGNGKVDNNDLILLTRYRARWKVTINMDAADVNGNGKVDNEDLILLTRYRARWKVTLLPGRVSTNR